MKENLYQLIKDRWVLWWRMPPDREAPWTRQTLSRHLLHFSLVWIIKVVQCEVLAVVKWQSRQSRARELSIERMDKIKSSTFCTGKIHFPRPSFAIFCTKFSKASHLCTNMDSSIATSNRRICCAWARNLLKLPTLDWPERSDRGHRTPITCPRAGTEPPKCSCDRPTIVRPLTFGRWVASWPSCTHSNQYFPVEAK